MDNKKIKEITLTEYVQFLGVSRPAIIYRIKKDKPLPGIESFKYDVPLKKYIFKFKVNTTKEEALKYFQKLQK